MITARPLTAEELNELATRAAAAVSMGLQAADDTQARMLATITQLAERYSELHRQNGLLRGERDQARAELAAMRDGLVAIYSPGDERGPYTDSSYTLAAAQAIVVDGGSVWTRLVGQWREVEGGDAQ